MEFKIEKIGATKGYSITKKGQALNKKGMPRKCNKDTAGYLNFSIRNENGKSRRLAVHRLQAYQKFGDELFKDGICVRHIDGDPLNNSWDNIEIGTQSQNMMDKPKKVRVESALNATRKNQDSIRSLQEREKVYQWLYEGIPYNWIIENSSISSKGTLSYMKNKSIEYKEFIKKYTAT